MSTSTRSLKQNYLQG